MMVVEMLVRSDGCARCTPLHSDLSVLRSYVLYGSCVAILCVGMTVSEYYNFFQPVSKGRGTYIFPVIVFIFYRSYIIFDSFSSTIYSYNW